MRLLYENMLVSELEDDLLMSNGVVTSYDSDSPYMFCEIKNISEQAMYDLGLDEDTVKTTVLVIKRYAKEEYISGTYFVSSKDIRGVLTRDEYNKMTDRRDNNE